MGFNESSYFKNLRKNCEYLNIEIPPRPPLAPSSSAIPNTPSLSTGSGYALLRGRHWSYYLQSLSCIIGRSPTFSNSLMKSSSTPRVIWHCDLSLPAHTPKVSRQHALIIFNFQDQYWEIRCLSRKYGVRIGKSKVIRWGDPAVRLSGTG